MVPKHDGARPHKPSVSATVFPVKNRLVKKEKRKRMPYPGSPYQGPPYPCMLPKTWSTKGLLISKCPFGDQNTNKKFNKFLP